MKKNTVPFGFAAHSNRATAGSGSSSNGNNESNDLAREASNSPGMPGSDDDDDADNPDRNTLVHDYLGISGDRAEEMQKEMARRLDELKASGKPFHAGSILKAIEPVAQSPLEGVFLGWVTHGIIDSMNNPLAGLAALLGGMGMGEDEAGAHHHNHIGFNRPGGDDNDLDRE